MGQLYKLERIQAVIASAFYKSQRIYCTLQSASCTISAGHGVLYIECIAHVAKP